MKQKLFTLLLAIVASVGTMSAADAIGRLNYGGLYFVLYTDYTAILTNNNGVPYSFSNPTRVTIPSSIEYNNDSYSVIAIADNTFSLCPKLYEIDIPESITVIGKNAFSYTNLSNVVIPNNVTYIGESAFLGCSNLQSITLSDELTSIQQGLFQGCTNLSSIVIPDKVTSIGQIAFWYCSSLSSVTIGESVTSIYSGCFNATSNITSVDWKAINCTSYHFGNQVESFTFGNKVEAIPSSICKGMNKLTSITIPNSVTSIGSSAFYGCTGLTSITIPDSVTNIGSSAFYGCTSLTSIAIPDRVTSIGSSAFYGCTGLTSAAIGNNVTNIGNSAFSGCIGLTSLTIPNSVTDIGSSAFSNCSNLESLTISEGVTNIGSSAFSYCSSLTSVTFPISVMRIDMGAFNNCTSLQFIKFLGENAPIMQFPFANTNDCPIYIPCGSYTSYSYALATYYERLTLSSDCVTSYVVTFVDWNGQVLKIEQVEKGHAATAPANPTREGYTFTGWDKDFSNVQSDLTVTAQYVQNTPSVTYYTVTFKDWDGTVLKTQQVEKGHAATAPVNPTRDGYTFTGWDKDFSNVQSDLIVTAQYKKNEEVAVTDVSLNKKTLQIMEGGNYTLTATVFPANASNKTITWTSSNTAVATVSNTGKITAKTAGVCTISCETSDGHFKAECYVVVSATNSETDYSYEPSNAISICYEATEVSFTEVPENGCVFATLSNNENALYLMYIGSLVNGVIPAGVYPISSSLQVGTIFYSIGGDEAYDYGSFLATSFDSEGYYSAAYYIIAGKLTVNSNHGCHAELVSVNGTDIDVTYSWTEAVENIPLENKVSKLLHNGQILILRGDKTYTLTGQEVK